MRSRGELNRSEVSGVMGFECQAEVEFDSGGEGSKKES